MFHPLLCFFGGRFCRVADNTFGSTDTLHSDTAERVVPFYWANTILG
jgi:hypothetical protein